MTLTVRTTSPTRRHANETGLHRLHENNERRETKNEGDEDHGKRPKNTSKAETNDERKTNESYAPYHDSPMYHENVLCLITATHYVVSCSIGNTQRTMLPFHAVFDTGSGMNIVKRDALFDGWEK